MSIEKIGGEPKAETNLSEEELNLKLHEAAAFTLFSKIDTLNEESAELEEPIFDKYLDFASKQAKKVQGEKEIKISDEEKQGWESLKYAFTILKSLAELKDDRQMDQILESAAKTGLNNLFHAAELYHLIDVNVEEIIPESKNYDQNWIADNVNEAIASLKKTALYLAKAKFPKHYEAQKRVHGNVWKKINKGRSFDEGNERVNRELIKAISSKMKKKKAA